MAAATYPPGVAERLPPPSPPPPQCAITACSAYMYIPRIRPAGVAIATCGPGAHASVGAQHCSHRACSSPADQGTGAHADGRGFLRMERHVREASGSRVVCRQALAASALKAAAIRTMFAVRYRPHVHTYIQYLSRPWSESIGPACPTATLAQIRNSTRLDQASNTRLAVACSTAHKACGALASRGS